ncbi:MAG TPA: PAS domain S-box protein [Geobacteraceae bacterium]|nr:PAS domain S-box protein [Geobacteraceae bacterium]
MLSGVAENNRKRITLLLVDGSDNSADEIKRILSTMQPEVYSVVARTLAEARSWLDNNTPDLAIVDLNLPDGKGTLLLPFDRSIAHFPIVLMSDAGNEIEAVDAIKGGALDYLVKSPELFSELKLVIERSLKQWGFILRQRLIEDALRDSEERFRSIFYTAAAGMVLVSPLKNIMQVNPAFCRFTGYEEDELLNRKIDEFAHPEDRNRVAAMYEELFDLRQGSIDCERRFVTKAGDNVWGHVSLSCIVASDGSPAYCIALVQDISLRKALEEKLLQANRELDSFVHTVSHDLRSPLTPIIGYIQFISEQYSAELSPQVIEMLDEVLCQAERMNSMLEDLLALSTVGSVEPPLSPTKGEEVLKNIQLRFSSEFSPDGTTIDITALPDIRIPKTLYQLILDNLISNAIRYSGKDKVEVRGELNEGAVRLTVRDYGPGVAGDEKERIFNLFYRGTTSQRISGTGIGLATVQKIAKLYKGRAWVEDAPGGGSLFIVEMFDVG